MVIRRKWEGIDWLMKNLQVFDGKNVNLEGGIGIFVVKHDKIIQDWDNHYLFNKILSHENLNLEIFRVLILNFRIVKVWKSLKCENRFYTFLWKVDIMLISSHKKVNFKNFSILKFKSWINLLKPESKINEFWNFKYDKWIFKQNL